MATDVGTGTTLTFTGIDTTELLSVEHSGWSTVSVDTTHMGSTESRSFIPGDLYDPGILTVEIHWEPAQTLPSFGSTTFSISYAGVPTTNLWSGNGFLQDFTINSPLEDKMTATAVIKLTGDIDKT